MCVYVYCIHTLCVCLCILCVRLCVYCINHVCPLPHNRSQSNNPTPVKNPLVAIRRQLNGALLSLASEQAAGKGWVHTCAVISLHTSSMAFIHIPQCPICGQSQQFPIPLALRLTCTVQSLQQVDFFLKPFPASCLPHQALRTKVRVRGH